MNYETWDGASAARAGGRGCTRLLDTWAPADAVTNAYPQLSDEEATVLALRVGVASGTPRTVAQVAALTARSRRKVRRIERKALSKMRHPSAA